MRFALLALLAAASCQGGWHRRGERQFIAQTAYGTGAGNLLFAGTKEACSGFAATAAMAFFPRDRIAVVPSLSYRYYDQNDGPVNALEFQILGRYYFPLEFHLGKMPVGLFCDIGVGVLEGSRSIPEKGTDTNITAEAGLGGELILNEKTSLLLGYRGRHTSNGGGHATYNPGYNEHVVFLGFAWRW